MGRTTKTALVFIFLTAVGFVPLYYLHLDPRPADTTDGSIYQRNAHGLDYCAKPKLTSGGLSADDIPKAYTPYCGFRQWPAPILAGCTEPLAPNAADLRGLWQAVDGRTNHVERIEQCGNRVIVLNDTFIHDFRTTGRLREGANDIHPAACTRTRAAVRWDKGKTLVFRGFGLKDVVTRRLADENTLIWNYFGTTTRLKRICRLPG